MCAAWRSINRYYHAASAFICSVVISVNSVSTDGRIYVDVGCIGESIIASDVADVSDMHLILQSKLLMKAYVRTDAATKKA